MAQIAANPWSFVAADQAATAAITSIVRNGTESALITTTAPHGLLANALISVQATATLWNGGYRIIAVPTTSTILVAIPDYKSTLANLGAVGNIFSAAYMDMIRAEQILWDTAGAGTLLLTDVNGDIVWNPTAVAGQGPYTYGKVFYIRGLVLNTIPSGVVQVTVA